LVCTDPNESLEDDVNIYKVKSNKKDFYITLLNSDIDFEVISYEDVFEVLHQSIIEMVHYIGDRYKFVNDDGTHNKKIKELIIWKTLNQNIYF